MALNFLPQQGGLPTPGKMPKLEIIIPPELPVLMSRLEAADRLAAMTTAADLYAPILNRQLVEYSQQVAGSGPFASGWRVSVQAGPKIRTINTYGKARWIDLPTKAHRISAVRAQSLAFSWGSSIRKTGVKPGRRRKAVAVGLTFLKSVWHPGTYGKYAYQRTVEANVKVLFKLISQEITSFLKGA